MEFPYGIGRFHAILKSITTDDKAGEGKTRSEKTGGTFCWAVFFTICLLYFTFSPNQSLGTIL